MAGEGDPRRPLAPASVRTGATAESPSPSDPLGGAYNSRLAIERREEIAVGITDIYEGTQQIQHLIIARGILGYGRRELS